MKGFGHYHAYIRDVLHTGHEDQSTTTSTAAEKAKEEEKVEETTAAPAVNDDHPLAEKKNESGGESQAGRTPGGRNRGRGRSCLDGPRPEPLPAQRPRSHLALRIVPTTW